jgi:hypothetical protein
LALPLPRHLGDEQRTDHCSAGAGNPGASWHVAAVGDYNGDGKSDILFRNDNGTMAICETNGGKIIGSAGLGNPGSTWHVTANPQNV